jgi:hypothetical protein
MIPPNLKGGRMKIPKTIKVGGHTVPVLFGKKIQSGKSNCLGLADTNFQTIFMVKKYQGHKRSKSCLWGTLLHEIIHLISEQYACELSEKQVRRITNGLFAVLKDNKLRF